MTKISSHSFSSKQALHILLEHQVNRGQVTNVLLSNAHTAYLWEPSKQTEYRMHVNIPLPQPPSVTI